MNIKGVSCQEGPNGRRIVFDEEADGRTFTEFLSAMMADGQEFEVYDPLMYPGGSDPGAYFGYSPANGRWLMTFGNHGWSGGIFDIELEVLHRQLVHLHELKLLQGLDIDEVFFCDHYNMEPPAKSAAINEQLRQFHAQV